MTDISRVAARRLAAQRRNARRLVEDEEEENIRAGGDADDSSTSIRLVGTVYDAEDARSGAQGAAMKAIKSAHDERRAINQRIYGRLNVVEDVHGFTPTTFLSSRNSKAATAAASSTDATAPSATAASDTSSKPRFQPQRVSDFMDEEDLADAGVTAVNSTQTGRGAFTQSSSANLQTAGELVAPAASNSIALKLLKAMGWRQKSHSDISQRSKKKARVYGAELPPGMKDSLNDDSVDTGGDDGLTDLVAFARLMDGSDDASLGGGAVASVPLYTNAPKNDTKGIGYVPYSQLSAAAKSKYDASSTSLTFVRAKHASDSSATGSILQPKEYSIEVPPDFDGRHYFPLPEREDKEDATSSAQPTRISDAWNAPTQSTPLAPPSSTAKLIHAWQGKMDAVRRGQLLGEQPIPFDPARMRGTLPLPPPPPPARSSVAVTAAPPVTDAAASDNPPSALDLQQHRRLEAIALAERGGRPTSFVRPGAFNNTPPIGSTSAGNYSAPGYTSVVASIVQTQSTVQSGTSGQIDIKAAIAAAAAKAAAINAEREKDQKKSERRARWGPIPSIAADVPIASSNAAPHLPLAHAFLSQHFGADAAAAALPQLAPVAADATSSTVAATVTSASVATSSTHASAAPLSMMFPKFVVAGEFDPTSGASSASVTSDSIGASASTNQTLNATSINASIDTTGMLRNFTSGSESIADTAAGAPSTSAVPLSAAARMDLNGPTGPFADYFAAAKMKQFGRLTRRVEEWIPHNLVYKRLGVPVPSRHAQKHEHTQPSGKAKSTSTQGIAVPGFPSFVQSATMYGSIPDPNTGMIDLSGGLQPGLNSSVPTPTVPTVNLASIDAEIAEEEEAMIQAELARDDQELYGEPISINPHAPSTTSDPTIHPVIVAAVEEKPSLDLFKAIFEASSSDEEEESMHQFKHKVRSKPVEPPAIKSRWGDAVSTVSSAVMESHTTVPVSKSSGIVHPDRMRQVPSVSSTILAGNNKSTLSASGVESLFASASSQSDHDRRPAIDHRPQPSHQHSVTKREIISIDDDDSDVVMSDSVPIRGFAGTKNAPKSSSSVAAPPAFVNNLQFVPASKHPPSHRTAGLTARGDRFGGSSRRMDDDDTDEYTGFSSNSKSLRELGSNSRLRDGKEGEEDDEPLEPFRRDKFVPPPLPPPRASVILPPAVPAAWPFASSLPRAEGNISLPPKPTTTTRLATPSTSSATVAAPPSIPPAPTATAALLSQLLELHQQHKEEKKRSKHAKKEKSNKKESKNHKHKKHSKEAKKHKRSRSRDHRHHTSDSRSDSTDSDQSDSSHQRHHKSHQ
jgi:hypothetical protein